MMNPFEGSPMDEIGITKSLRGESLSWRDDRKLASLRYKLSGKLSNEVMSGLQLTTGINVFSMLLQMQPAPGLFELLKSENSCILDHCR